MVKYRTNNLGFGTGLIILLAAIIILGLAGSLAGALYYYRQQSATVAPTPTPTATPSASTIMSVTPTIATHTPSCQPADLKATLTLQGAAGNIYGSFQIENTSTHSCQINAQTYVEPQYDKQTVTNLTTIHTGNSQGNALVLTPSQSVYASLHYPNGPQCNSSTNTTNISYTYQTPDQSTITFANQDGQTTFTIPTCQNSTVTQIDLSNFTTTPPNL